MSKIDDLIQEFCPDGVEYKPIKKLAEVGTGSSNGNEAQEDGKYPFFIRSQTVKRKMNGNMMKKQLLYLEKVGLEKYTIM